MHASVELLGMVDAGTGEEDARRARKRGQEGGEVKGGRARARVCVCARAGVVRAPNTAHTRAGAQIVEKTFHEIALHNSLKYSEMEYISLEQFAQACTCPVALFLRVPFLRCKRVPCAHAGRTCNACR